MGAADLDPPPPPPPLRTPSPLLTRTQARSPIAAASNVPRKLPDDFVEAAMRELEREHSIASASDKENRNPDGAASGPGRATSSSSSTAPRIGPLTLTLPRGSASPRLAGLLPTDMSPSSTTGSPAYALRARDALDKETMYGGGFGARKADYEGDARRGIVSLDDEGVYEDPDADADVDVFNGRNESRLVENRRRYPLTTPGGYAPTHLRQQFCLIDHPHRHTATDAAETSTDSSLMAAGTSHHHHHHHHHHRQDKQKKPPSLLSRLLSLARRSRKPAEKWWRWEIRATYQRPFSLSASGLVTPTPSGAHVELSIWTRAAVPLAHAVVWGVPWRQGRMADVPDAFGPYDGCARHPAGALGRWGSMVERKAYFDDGARGDWTARASVVHDDREWLEKVAPEELVSMEAANTIEIYDTAHELCFLLDANTNQWWLLKDSIPAEQGQWLGDNVWNVVHGFDEGSWVRRSLQYRKRIG